MNDMLEVRIDEDLKDQATAAVKAMRQTSIDNGNDELSLDEINEIIAEVRKNKNNH